MPPEPFTKKDYATIVADLLGTSRDTHGGRTGLSDGNAGSVVRTLMEAFARELALCYAQLDVVWRAGYLETAKGQALDNVVALLGIERQRGGHLVGAVEFSRSQPAEGDIAIPAGTLVAGRGRPPAETTREVLLHKGERVVRVDVQSVEPSTDGKPIPAESLTLMPQPIAGIEAVRNTLELVVRQQPENDDELQARARALMRRAHTATKASIETAVRACGVSQVRIMDSADDPSMPPATVTVVVGDTKLGDDTMNAIQAAVREVRPAGVRVTVAEAAVVNVEVAATLRLSRSATPAEQKAVFQRARSDLEAYFGQLAIGETVRVSKLSSLLAADDRVVEVQAELTPQIDGSAAVNHLKRKNGDVQLQPSQRAKLRATDPWPKLVVVHPGCRIDASLQVDPAKVDATTESRAKEALEEGIDFINKKIMQVILQTHSETDSLPKPLDVTYEELRDCVFGSIDDKNFASVSFTIVHEHQGRAARLTKEGDRDSVPLGEVPRLGRVQITSSMAGE